MLLVLAIESIFREEKQFQLKLFEFVNVGNDCTLKCAQKFNPDLRKVKDGRCGQCNCPLVLAPVCGSDNVSYRNICALNCNKEKAHDLFKVSDGRCG